MLANLNDVLLPAREHRYGVGLFNTVNFEMARGVLAAAEKLRSPVIIGTAEVLLPYGPLEELSYFLIPMAKKASVPVVVHYDHGLTFDKCVEALRLGFTSVMYDCSTDSYEENVRKVKEIAVLAHSFGATVEAELGHVGDTEGTGLLSDPTAYYTDPLQAKDFVEKTGTDALAIAVGSAHGAYKFPPKLDFERIRAIRDTVPTPLVLHGGSGLTDEDFRLAIASGISKINIFTDINLAQAAAAKAALDAGLRAMTDIIPQQVEAVERETGKKMRLFLGNAVPGSIK